MSSKWSEGFKTALMLRLGLWYAALFAIGAIGLLVFTYALLGRALAAQDREVLASTLARYAAEYHRSGLTGLKGLVEADEGEGRHERLLVRVMNKGTELVYFAHPPGWAAFDLSALDDRSRISSGLASLVSPVDGSILEVGTDVLPDGVTIQVGRSSHVRDELLSNFRDRAMEVGAALVVTAILGGLFIAYVALAPVRSLEATTQAILETRRFDARVVTRGTRDPLDQLGARINEMLSQIQALVTGMRGALDNVAHDLRTPLTRFRNVAELALTQGDPAKVRDGLADAVEEADRVSATLTALIDVSEAEAGTMRLSVECLRVKPVAEEAISLFADEADERGVVLECAIEPGLEVNADRTRLRQVLANLVENAVKYTRDGGRITLAAREEEDAVITVSDTGIGIAPHDLPLVWDRLYRADVSRSARGLGLGLSLVKAIVEAHGGHVSARSVPGRGSTFSVALPRVPRAGSHPATSSSGSPPA